MQIWKLWGPVLAQRPVYNYMFPFSCLQKLSVISAPQHRSKEEAVSWRARAGLLPFVISFVNGLPEPAGKFRLHSTVNKRGSVYSQYLRGLCCLPTLLFIPWWSVILPCAPAVWWEGMQRSLSGWALLSVCSSSWPGHHNPVKGRWLPLINYLSFYWRRSKYCLFLLMQISGAWQQFLATLISEKIALTTVSLSPCV